MKFSWKMMKMLYNFSRVIYCLQQQRLMLLAHGCFITFFLTYVMPNFCEISGKFDSYIIICETNCQSRFDAGYRMLRAGALG